MVIKDKAKSHISSNVPPSMSAAIEFEEICCLCDRDIPNDALVLRHTGTRNIICLFCLTDIALVPIDERG